MSLENQLNSIINIDILEEAKNEKLFVGRPFYLDYEKAYILISDDDKYKVSGVPQGAFLLAFYDNDPNVSEALLLRALRPTKLPTDNDLVSSMIQYYKDDLKTTGNNNQLDDYTRYHFSFSGLECRILGTFYKIKSNDKDSDSILEFGADVENFFSAYNYSIYKPTGEVLKQIVNQRDGDQIAGNINEFKIGCVRYSSSRRFQSLDNENKKVEVFINSRDFLGKRTALFGMTRTGKSNTVKKIIQASVEISNKATKGISPNSPINNKKLEENLEPFDKSGAPKYKAGQIIFDINGEYANPNMQDEGTAIYELYKNDVTRYSVLPKEDFKVLKVNFYTDINSGFEIIKAYLRNQTVDYVTGFTTVDLEPPEGSEDFSANTRWERKKAAYLCCLYAAGFPVPADFKVNFEGNATLNALVRADGTLNPRNGITLEDAKNWFTFIWNNYNSNPFFATYRQENDNREWADEELQSLLIFLTRKKNPTGRPNISGYQKLKGVIELHTDTLDISFEVDIINQLRQGKIVIIDLSQGEDAIKSLYSEKITTAIFRNAMSRFIQNIPNNFIQFYFEEAHNLFPKKDDKNLSDVYNRIAKEGAKLNLGMIYATQEVSSISGNILKATQNWFIAHLNNDDEIKEIKKYYDFGDFTESLVRFSAKNDKGFVRMKTYSNSFVVPIQMDRFLSDKR